jgi:hypothetical protein
VTERELDLDQKYNFILSTEIEMKVALNTITLTLLSTTYKKKVLNEILMIMYVLISKTAVVNIYILKLLISV